MHLRRQWLWVLGGLGGLACASIARSAGHASYVISADSLRHRLEDFAADSMLGRSFVDGGHDRATTYLARAASRIGLEPAGEDGSWFQTFHMYWRRLSPQSRIVVGDSTLFPVRDFKVFSAGRGQPRSMAGAQVIYGGIVGDTSTQISSDAAASRVVLLGVPPDMTPERVYRDVGYGPASRFGRAAGVAIASFDYLSPSQRAIFPAVGLLDPTTQRADIQPSTLLVTRRAAAMLLGRPLEGALAGALGRTVDAHITIDERDIPTRNVAAILRGRDAALAHTYVALGAHSDHFALSTVAMDHDSVRAAAFARHLYGEAATPAQMAALRQDMASGHASRRDSIFNGADDDGSGSVALLEVARALASGIRPRRSVLFVWHAAEEDGLIGSMWFVEHPTVPLDSIMAQVNLDMVGRGGVQDIVNGGAHFVKAIGASRRSPALWMLLDSVNARSRAPFVIDTADTEGAYCRSDHWSYARFGVPVVFLTTGSHPDYHAVSDEAGYIDYAKLTAVSGLTLDLVHALADRASRIPVSGSKPDPRAFCHG